MKILRFGLICVSLFLFSSCAVKPVVDEQGQRDQALLQSWQLRREEGKSRDNLPEIENFLKSRASSPYMQAARLEQAQALLEDGKPHDAENIFRSVREVALGKEESLTAQSEWGLSFTAEADGDDLKAFAHVLGAEKMSQNLPPAISKAELPARKAFLLQKQGRTADANLSLLRADQGLRELQTDPKTALKPDQVLRLSYQIGSALSENVTEENYAGFLNAQRSSQVYLLKVLTSGHPVWAPKALEILRRNFQSFWNFLVTRPLPSGAATLVSKREQRQSQVPRLSEFMSVITQAQAYAPLNEKLANPWQKQFFEMLNHLQINAQAVMSSTSETMVLTQESQMLNGLRRAGRIAEPPRDAIDKVGPVRPDPNL